MFKIFCLMFGGKPITEKIADILFVNAHDMIDEQNKEQFIKGKDYEGLIKSDLSIELYAGSSGIVFEADIFTEQNGQNKVKYFVRSKDLDGVEKASWLVAGNKIRPRKKNKGNKGWN